MKNSNSSSHAEEMNGRAEGNKSSVLEREKPKNDCFYFMGWALFLAACLLIFVKKVKPTSGAVGH